MKLIITVPDDFVPVEGDAYDAVVSALQHFDIPATIKETPRPLTNPQSCNIVRGMFTVDDGDTEALMYRDALESVALALEHDDSVSMKSIVNAIQTAVDAFENNVC